jgi:Protein of unknown function (DUF4231)
VLSQATDQIQRVLLKISDKLLPVCFIDSEYMSDTEALTYLESELEKRIQSFDERRKYYRKMATYFTIGNAALSSLTTFLIAVEQIYQVKPLAVAALAVSASMSVLTALNSLFTYQKRWVQSNDTLMQLRELKSRIKYLLALDPALMPEHLNQFEEDYQRILRQANEGWRIDRSLSE